MLKVSLGEQALGRTKVSEWIFMFKVGVNCAKSAENLGCPVTANQIKVWTE
jgi:hypothetical protein